MATIGVTISTGDWRNGTYLWACKFQAPSSGNLSDIEFFGYMGTYGTKYKIGIWEDSSGPGPLLASSSELSGPGGNWRWHPGQDPGATISGSIVASSYYWLGGWCESNQYQISNAGSSGQFKYRNIAYDGSLPNPFGTPDGSADWAIDIYANYTPTSGGVTIKKGSCVPAMTALLTKFGALKQPRQPRFQPRTFPKFTPRTLI